MTNLEIEIYPPTSLARGALLVRALLPVHIHKHVVQNMRPAEGAQPGLPPMTGV